MATQPPKPVKQKNIYTVFTLYHNDRIIDEKRVTYSAPNRETIREKVKEDSETWANNVIRLRHAFLTEELPEQEVMLGYEDCNSAVFKNLYGLLEDSCDVRLVKAIIDTVKTDGEIDEQVSYMQYLKDTYKMLQEHVKVSDTATALQIIAEARSSWSTTYTCEDLPVTDLFQGLAKQFLEQIARAYYNEYVEDILNRIERTSNASLKKRIKAFESLSESDKTEIRTLIEKVAEEAETFCLRQLMKSFEQNK